MIGGPAKLTGSPTKTIGSPMKKIGAPTKKIGAAPLSYSYLTPPKKALTHFEGNLSV